MTASCHATSRSTVEARRQAAWREADLFRTPALDPGAPRTCTSSLRRPSPRATSTSATSAPTRSATPTPVSRARAVTTCCSRSASTPSACRPSSARSPAACRRRLGRPLRRAHDRTARAARLLVRLGRGRSCQLGRRHVPLVAVAVPDPARGGLVYRGTANVDWCDTLPDDARHDPGRGRPLLALPQPRSPDRAPDVVPAASAPTRPRTTAGSTSCRPAANGTRSRSRARRFVLGRVDGVEIELARPSSSPGEEAGGARLLLRRTPTRMRSRGAYVLISPRSDEADAWAVRYDVVREQLESCASGGWSAASARRATIPVVDTGARVSAPSRATRPAGTDIAGVDRRFGAPPCWASRGRPPDEVIASACSRSAGAARANGAWTVTHRRSGVWTQRRLIRQNRRGAAAADGSGA